MTLYDYRDLFTDDDMKIRVYDLDNDAEIIYEGDFAELPEDLEDVEISSLDTIYPHDWDGYVGINVSFSDDDF